MVSPIPMDEVIKDTDFLSIIVLSFRRPAHTKRLLESIRQYADCPVEIILFDDASPEEDQVQIYNEMRRLVSTIVFNTGQPGVNGGISSAANRAVALTNSKYVLLLNNDLEMTAPCFRDIKEGLDLPYVGCLGPCMGVQIPPKSINSGTMASTGNLDFQLGSIPASSGLFAFRRETWERVGGFPYVYHNNADTAFHHIVLKHSMINATIVNRPQQFRNIDAEEGYVNATHGTTPFDQSYPHILGIDYEAFQKACIERKNRRYPESHRQYRIPFGINNIQSWSDYFETARTVDAAFDWEKLSAYEQNKWREVVDNNIEIWRNK